MTPRSSCGVRLKSLIHFSLLKFLLSELASLSVILSAFSRCSLALGKESRMASPKAGNTIAACFQAAKRVRVDAGVNAARISSIDPAGDGLAGDEAAGISKKAKVETVIVQASADAAGSGGGTSTSGSPGEEGASPSEEKEAELTKEQKMRMELNKATARAKRHLRTCEERLAQLGDGKIFPDFKDLLVEPTWLDVLQEEFSKPYMKTVRSWVDQEVKGTKPIYPPPALVFNALNSCPFDKVKVVIIGQDPYHGPRQAMGLCFSVPHGVKVPSSLINIFKEIRDDVGCSVPSHGNLEKWAHQGVLLLNAVLTVREHNANSHAKKGWESFTDAAIRAVSQQRNGIVFLLWGNSAQDKARLIDSKKHHVLKAAHPSGLSAHKGFFKCKHFSKANELLEKAGELPIDWQL